MKLDYYGTVDTLIFNAVTNKLTLDYLETLKQLGKVKGNFDDVATAYNENIEAIVAHIEAMTGLVPNASILYDGEVVALRGRITAHADGNCVSVTANAVTIGSSIVIEIASFKVATKIKFNDRIGK